MNNLTDEMKIANCQCCLLAKVMRDCDVCPFKIGLIYKRLEAVKNVKVEYPDQLKDATLTKLAKLTALV